VHSYSYSLHTTQTHINTHTPEDAILLLGFTIAFGQLKASCYGEGVDKMSPAALTCLDNKLELGLWVASGVYIAHGLAEMILGPYLVLPGAAEGDGEDADAMARPLVGGGGGGGMGREYADSVVITTPSMKSPSMRHAARSDYSGSDYASDANSMSRYGTGGLQAQQQQTRVRSVSFGDKA
jgi:hypothetical protein